MSVTQFPTFPWQDLVSWYESHGRHHLPWRDYTHPERLYRVWLSEILLQQTQVDRVIPFLEKILAKYPTIHHLAHSSYDEFFPYYQGLGYYSRARNILKTAKIISEEYQWIFPMDAKLLQKLPGVWWYTSSAILAFGYGEPYLAWDTNLEKVFARYYNGRRDMKLNEWEKEKIEEEFRMFIKNTTNSVDDISKVGVCKDSPLRKRDVTEWQGDLVPKKIPPTPFIKGEAKNLVRAINNALMDFAATVDLKNPDNIDWESYPIQSGKFYETSGTLEPREEKKSRTFPTPDATVIVILHEDHRVYYSAWWEPYTPFVLPPALSRDTRQYVQEFFRDNYSLELSVRPVHAKWLAADGRAYIAVNAQIQAWDRQQFQKTDKKTAQEVLKKMIP